MTKFKFEKLVIWRKAMSLGEDINETALTFTDYEKFNLSSQVRRATDIIQKQINIIKKRELHPISGFKLHTL